MINGYHFPPEWQTPDFGSLVREDLVLKAGRGQVLLVNHPRGVLVERAYRHGGLHRLFFPRWFMASDRAKSEFECHRRVFLAGIATVEPVGWREVSGVWPFLRRYFFYSVFLKDAKTLSSFLKSAPPQRGLIQQMAEILARLFRLGVYHHDLNLNNWLVSGQKLFLIDFDKASAIEGDALTYLCAVASRIARSGKKLGFLPRKRSFLRLVVATAHQLQINARAVVHGLPKHLNQITFLDRLRWALAGGHQKSF